jgi:hypothetical protein
MRRSAAPNTLPRIPLPPEDPPSPDPELSPHTGWTRAHWEAAADRLLDGVAPYAAEGGALYRLPGSASAVGGEAGDGLEGFSRTLLLAALRGAAPGTDAAPERLAHYAEGLQAGVRAAWPRPADLPQALPEAALIAVSLFEAREALWDPLPEPARQALARWLGEAAAVTGPTNNWLLFPVVIDSVLKRLGAAHDARRVERNLGLVDAMYAREGWYRDGFGESLDHYSGWALQLYLALWCRIDGDESDPARAALVRERLARFLEDYPRLFGGDGAPLYHGRSLIYRAAAAAPVWAGALLGCSPLRPGLTRRLASGALSYFLDRGALRDGVLQRGWHGEFAPMAQAYSGPASPYWLSKAFLGLLLPPDAPEWTEREEPLPVEEGDFRSALAGPGFLAWGTRADGIVRVASHRSDHFPLVGVDADPHYNRVLYSTHTAPDVDAAGADGQVTLESAAGTSLRERFRLTALGEGHAASVHHPGEWRRVRGRQVTTPRGAKRLPVHVTRRSGFPWVEPDPPLPDWADRLEVASVARGAAEIRVVHVTTLEPARVRSGAPAVAGAEAPAVEADGVRASARTASGLTAVSAGLHGFTSAGTTRRRGANAFGEHSAAPWVEAAVQPGETILVALHALSGPEAGEAGARHPDAPAEVAVGRRSVDLAWSDGERISLRLGGY